MLKNQCYTTGVIEFLYLITIRVLFEDYLGMSLNFFKIKDKLLEFHHILIRNIENRYVKFKLHVTQLEHHARMCVYQWTRCNELDILRRYKRNVDLICFCHSYFIFIFSNSINVFFERRNPL